MNNTKMISVLLAGSIALSACQSTSTEMSETRSAVAVADQVAAAKCQHSVPDRDNWLRKEQPPVSELLAGYQKRGIDPKDSSVFGAYSAYKQAKGDHEKAAVIFAKGYPGQNYANAASCFS